MKIQWIHFSVIALSTLLVSGCEKLDKKTPEKIKQQSENYVASYNKHDADALANQWDENAIYENPVTGDFVQGRDSIKQQFSELFKNHPDLQLKTSIKTITSPNENTAIEVGTATVSASDTTPLITNYIAFYEKKNNEWKLVKVKEIDAEEAPSHFEQLKPLEWLIGNWIDKDENGIIETSNSWDKYKNFITQNFKVQVLNNELYEGKQIIAWDPLNHVIRSWVFDSDGGYGEGKWIKKGNDWFVDSVYVTPEGRKATAINTYSDITPNSYTWQSTGRQIEGEILPNIEPVTVTKNDAKSRGE